MGTRNVRFGRAVARGAGGLLALPVAYIVAGLAGGAIPADRGRHPQALSRPPAQGVTIWVESNGVHTGIVVPKVAAGVDWRPIARPEHLADPRQGRHDHLSFGWGERAFYHETPSWWDIRPRTVLAAAFGSERTLVHVDHIPRPRPEPAVRAVVLTPDEYRRLAGYIARSFAPGAGHMRGYAAYDAFYEARGRYSGVRTCNSWTGEALRAAGVRMGRWTPFPVTVMWWL